MVWEEVVVGPEGLPFRPSISCRLCVSNLPRFQNRYRDRYRYRNRDQIAGMGDPHFLLKKRRKYRLLHFLNLLNYDPDSDNDFDSDSSMDQLDLKQVNNPRYRTICISVSAWNMHELYSSLTSINTFSFWMVNETYCASDGYM